MRIIEVYQQSAPVFSIEIFPPKTEQGVINLKKKLVEYKKYQPDFISVTYGAGGSTRENTHTMASYIKNELDIEAMAHLTCVSHTRSEIHHVLDELENANIENIMALRGDSPQGEAHFTPPENGFAYASELIETLVERQGFGIGAAAYPEGHLETPDAEVHFQHLLQKIDAGTEFLVTQFFLVNDLFLKWRDRLARHKVSIPVIPGILPALSIEQILRFAKMNGCFVPSALVESLEAHQHSPETMRQIGIDFAAKQIEDLLKEGVAGIHLYGLNRLESVEQLAPLITMTT